MVTEISQSVISPGQATAARKVAHSHRLNPAHISYALFDAEPDEITSRQASRLIDSIRIIGEMRSKPNTLFSVEAMLEEMVFKGAGIKKSHLLLTLDHLRRAGLAEAIGEGSKARYRYKSGSVEKATDRYNEENAILIKPQPRSNGQVGGIEI